MPRAVGAVAVRAGMADGTREVDAVDPHRPAHRHADGKVEARVLAVLVDHPERGVALSGLVLGQQIRKQFRHRDPNPIRHAEAELPLPAAFTAGRTVFELHDRVVEEGLRLVPR